MFFKEEIENSKGSKEAWNFPSNFGKTQEENFCVSANFFFAKLQFRINKWVATQTFKIANIFDDLVWKMKLQQLFWLRPKNIFLERRLKKSKWQNNTFFKYLSNFYLHIWKRKIDFAVANLPKVHSMLSLLWREGAENSPCLPSKSIECMASNIS